MKLIDKEAVVAEIERRLEELYEFLPDASKVENGSITISESCNTGKYTALESFKDYVDALKVKKIDLEKDIHSQWKNCIPVDEGMGSEFANISVEQFADIAKHFFELGLKAQHSSIGIPNIDDIFEEEGIDPNSKDAKIFKESYYMALEKLKAQKEGGV